MAVRRRNYRHQIFVQEYLVDLNGRNAAIRAGYPAQRATLRASELLRRPEIAAAVQSAMDARAARCGVTAARVIEELARIAFADIRQAVDWEKGGLRLKDASVLSDDMTAALASIASLAPSSRTGSKKDRRVQIAAHDKQHALDSLALILGLDSAAPHRLH